MANRVLRRTTQAAPALLLLLACAAGARAQGSSYASRDAAAARMSDAQVMKELTGGSEKKASRAVHEVMARGGRMIPLLLKLKGDRRCFYGDWELGSHAGCSSRMAPGRRDMCYEWNNASTVEVAALYLMEALYRNDLEFAQGATLMERDPEDTGQQRLDVKLNGREVIARAWETAEKWFAEFGRESLEALRAKDRGPFAGTMLGFY
jgi:hypothetical protein